MSPVLMTALTKRHAKEQKALASRSAALKEAAVPLSALNARPDLDQVDTQRVADSLCAQLHTAVTPLHYLSALADGLSCLFAEILWRSTNRLSWVRFGL